MSIEITPDMVARFTKAYKESMGDVHAALRAATSNFEPAGHVVVAGNSGGRVVWRGDALPIGTKFYRKVGS